MKQSLPAPQAALFDDVREFIHQQYSFERRAKIIADDADYNAEIWQQFVDKKWLQLPFASSDGGSSDQALDTVVLMMGMGQGLVIEPLLASSILSGGLITESCSEAVKRNLLPPLLAGEQTYASALYESRGRYQLNSLKTRAKPRRLGFSLSGRKTMVLNARSADKLIVSARTGGGTDSEGGISLFLLDPNMEGIRIEPYINIDGHAAADVVLDNVFVERRLVLGEANEALPDIERAVDTATLAICAEALGAMQVLNQKTLEHCKTRKQFGAPLASFQTLRHKMADMLIEFEQAQSSVIQAALAADDNMGFAAMEISAAKYRVGRAARKIAHDAIQLHGASGVTEDSPISHYFRRLTAIESLFGNQDFHLKRYIRLSNEDD